MNDILEFLNIKTKKRINFPLIKEVVELLKRYGITKYKINYNFLRFNLTLYNNITVEYLKSENCYCINQNYGPTCVVSESDNLISDLESHIKRISNFVFKLPNIKVPYPELKASDIVKR